MTYINFVLRVPRAVKLHYNMIYHYKLQLFIWSNCVHWKLSSQANNEMVLKYRSCFWRQWQPTPVLSPWMEEPGRLQSIGLRRVGHNWATLLSRIGEGNGNPLSVLAWRIPGMGEPGGLPSTGSHSHIRLKWLSSSSSNMSLRDISTMYLL